MDAASSASHGGFSAFGGLLGIRGLLFPLISLSNRCGSPWTFARSDADASQDCSMQVDHAWESAWDLVCMAECTAISGVFCQFDSSTQLLEGVFSLD